MRHAATVTTLVLVCAVGAGCSARKSDEVLRHVGTYEAAGEGGDGALLAGTVQIVEGCFFIEVSTGKRFLVHFPRDEVEWRDEGLRYAGSTYGAGDNIALGGGVSSDSRSVPWDCRDGHGALPQWIVAQSG